jgi:hypothetical protein
MGRKRWDREGANKWGATLIAKHKASGNAFYILWALSSDVEVEF